MPEPRHVWRRLVAFAVDHTLALILVSVMALPLIGHGMRLPKPMLSVRTVECRDLDRAPDWLAPILGTQVSVLKLCRTHLWGLPNGDEIVAIWHHQQQGALRTGRHLRVMVDADLNPVGLLATLPDLLVLLVLACGSAGLTLAGRRTPGKALMGLWIVGPRARAPLREGLRLAPFLAFYLLWLGMEAGLLPHVLLWSFDAIVAGVAGGLAVFFLWYLLPLLRWRGAMPWDRLTGFRVHRIAKGDAAV